MRDRNHKAVSREVIAELMLAKTVLEEKNEIIDEKDRIIRELYSKEKELETELVSFKREIESAKAILRRYVRLNKTEHDKSPQSGIQKVIADVVAIAADYQSCISSAHGRSLDINGSLAGRLMTLFVESYDLEVLDGAPKEIDPKIHQVVEVIEDKHGESSFVQLSKGYRIGKKVIRPMGLKVLKGTKETNQQQGATLRFTSPRLEMRPDSYSDPDEVA